ncbi:MAG: hypothetical protein K0U38_06140 [Epsilonproteobacteria bacterium]|nr:hypothetical protein [Campylobacterota bacterium]
MKKLTLSSLTVISGLLLTGCNPNSMMSHTLDPNLPRVQDVKAIADSTSIGFEWQPLYKQGVEGMNIYRTEANSYSSSTTKQLTKVGTVSNPFASHYVDTGLKQNSTYTYTFTTIRGGYESPHGKVIELKTLAPMSAVTFFQGAQRAKNTVKLIWRPHPDKRVKRYRIERSMNGQNWKIVGSVENRMMVEYIDSYVAPGSRYQYRIMAIGYDGSFSNLSNVLTIDAR